MEESLSMLQAVREKFACSEVDIRTYSPLTLAFMGDSVFDFIIRTIVVEKGNRAANNLHKQTSQLVKASSQAAMAEAIMAELSTEEQAVYRRGRNAKSYTSAKHASLADYRKATGFEALLGYLYLQDRMDRVLEIIQSGVEKTEKKENMEPENK